MSAITWNVAVDWNGDGDFSDTGEDVTTRVLDAGEPVDIAYGRDQDRALSPLAAGVASLVLNNDSKDYSPDNTSSPLAGLVRPGKSVQVQATHSAVTRTLFRGHIDDPKVSPEDQSMRVSCLDVLARLKDATASTAVHHGIKSGQAIHYILDAIGWPEDKRDIDDGATTIRYWWAEGDAWDELERVVQSEGPPSLVTVNGDGYVVFRDRHHRLTESASLTSQATFQDAGAEPVFSAFTYEAGWRDIVNAITFSVDVRHPEMQYAEIEKVDGSGKFVSAHTEVWASDEIISLSAGETVEVKAEGSDPFVSALVPEEGRDYVLRSGSVEITLTRDSGKSTTIRIKAPTAPAVISKLRMRAYPLPVQRTIQVVERDGGSITTYGERSGGTDAPWAGVHDARAVALAILAQRSEYLPTVTFTLEGGDDDTVIAQQLDRDLSDRITVVETQTVQNGPYFIESIKHQISGGGSWLTTVVGCEKARDQVTSVFRFDTTGQGFDDGKFGIHSLDDPANMFRFDVSGQGFDQGMMCV